MVDREEYLEIGGIAIGPGRLWSFAAAIGDVPAKEPGAHRWVATVTHSLTDEQADAFDPATAASPAASTIVAAPILGCIDCAQLHADAKTTPCPAGDEWDDRR